MRQIHLIEKILILNQPFFFSRNPDGDWVWSSDSDDADSDDDDSNSPEPQNATAAPNAEPLKKIEEVNIRHHLRISQQLPDQMVA